jgi:hypothetical protein
VVLQVFREAALGRSQARLEAELDDLDPSWVSESIESLEHAGVIVVKRRAIYPSGPLRRLAALEMVCSERPDSSDHSERRASSVPAASSGRGRRGATGRGGS